jgi:hypothetical protein
MMCQRLLTSRSCVMAGACLFMGIFAGACSAASGTDVFGAGGSGGNSSGTQASSGDDISNPDDFTTAGSGSDSGLGEGCASSHQKAEQVPLDMYIMLDKSGSMDEKAGGSTKWKEVTKALKTFLEEPSAAGISVGIQYFPLLDPCVGACNTTADCGGPSCGSCFLGDCVFASPSESCVTAVYAKPDVEIALLPGAAKGIIDSMANQKTDGGTPTSAALKGAIQHAKEWALQNPTHVTINVLATDGKPEGCDNNLDHINAIAAEGVSGTPKILTFVIGVGKLPSLDGIAAAGGTEKAFIVDTAQNPGEQFLAAMNKIRGAALACSYIIPAPTSGTPDYNSVNVQYTPGGGGMPVIFPKVEDKAHCEAGVDAWYYDNNAAPKQIVLCDSTCTTLSTDTKGQVDIVLGCDTVVK